MSATLQQQPVAEGSLAETPFAHVAIYLYRRTTTGTLVLRGERGREVSIRFQQGRPTGARVPWPASRLLDALLPLCGLEEGTFVFFEGDALAGDDDALTGVVDPYEMLVASLDQHARDDMVDAVLQRYEGIKLRLQPGRDLDRLGLSSETRPLIELMRAAPATVDELVRLSPLRKEQVRRTLYALVITHMICLHEERSREIYKSQVETRSGRPPFVQVNEIAAGTAPAWQSLASLRPGAPSSGRPPVTVSSRPPGSSVRPIATIPPRAPTQTSRTADADLRALQFRKAEQLMQRGSHDEALALLSELLSDEPERAELHALRGHTLLEKHRGSSDGLPREVMDSLKRAIELDPDQARALYARGLIYQRAGDGKKALSAFRRVLQVDPKHIEARREVRLAKLRGA